MPLQESFTLMNTAEHKLDAIEYFVSLIDFSKIEQRHYISINVIVFYNDDDKVWFPITAVGR